MKNTTETSALSLLANDAGYDPLEDRLRENIRSTIEAVFEEELAQFLGRCRYGREDALRQGYRNGHRERQLTGTFGTERVSVPRARIVEEDGRASEWRSRALPRYQRLTRKAEALIASVYLSGTNTRRVKRALFGLFRGAVSKDVVSRAWRKVKVDWDAWCSRGLADEDIVRLILDGTVIKTRLDRKATNISVLAAIGVRRDGQKVLLSIGNMGGESQAAWRQFLDDLDARGLKRPGFVIVDGAPGLEAALSALWGDDLPVQRCTVHKHRNLLGHAPKHMHDELSEDYRDMVYADTASEVETPDQNTDRAAVSRNSADAPLGAPRFRPNPGAFDEDVEAAGLLQEFEAKISALERLVGRQAAASPVCELGHLQCPAGGTMPQPAGRGRARPP